jgi:hypothetical protein
MNATWTFISCSSIDVIMLTIALNSRLGDQKHLSLEHSELTISFGCHFEPNEPKDLVAHIKT